MIARPIKPGCSYHVSGMGHDIDVLAKNASDAIAIVVGLMLREVTHD